MRKRLGDFFELLPLVGPLRNARLTDHKEAFVEVGTTVLLATVPIWLGSLLLLADSGKDTTFWQNLVQNLRDGEILLFCTSLTGPLFYFMFVQGKQMPAFPAARSLMLSSVLVLLISVGFFSLQRAESLFGTGDRIDKDFIYTWSVYAFLFATIIVYLATCFRHFREGGAASYQKTQTENFVSEYNRNRAGE